MTDRKSGAFESALQVILYALSVLYGLGIVIRKILYKYAIFETKRVPVKVISVGNLTLGGTGKTPFVIELAKILKNDMGKEASILIRGYGWDEQAMLKNSLPDMPILVGENRARSAKRAIKFYGSDATILDDGFQYWELGRDLDIVLIDSRNPFGNGHLFPRGILREGKNALKRAHIVVFTKVDKALRPVSVLKDELRAINDKLLFLESIHRPAHVHDEKARKDLSLAFLRGKKALLLSSIGDGSYFEDTAKDLGVKVLEHMKFPDHYNYAQEDIRKIMKRCGEVELDIILTTEKDAVKLNRMSFSFGNYPLMTLVVHIDIIFGREHLIDRLNSLYISQNT